MDVLTKLDEYKKELKQKFREENLKIDRLKEQVERSEKDCYQFLNDVRKEYETKNISN